MSMFWIIYLATLLWFVLVFAYGAYIDYNNDELNWYRDYQEFDKQGKKIVWFMMFVIFCPVINTVGLFAALVCFIADIFKDNK
jgi:hypothetical protein